MAATMSSSSVMGTKVVSAQRSSVRVAAAPVACSLRTEVAKVAKMAGVSFAAFALAASAQAATVKLGADNGALVFEPATVTIKSGESVVWVNNVGFPHNVVFDEDEVPAGVNADALSHEDYLNAAGASVSTKFDTAGEYGYYCEPHQGAGMVGKVIVQ